jgi:SAM-dependent methyltransferase
LSSNRLFWNRTSDDYQRRNGAALDRAPLAWGVWRIPESEISALGSVEGRRVLELGCGAAQWTLALRERGVRAVGVDLSEQQLVHASRQARAASAPACLVQGDAVSLPFADGSFDVVFCDHGAATFAPPSGIVPEASRVLAAGGLFVFCMSTPIRDICEDLAAGVVTERLHLDYFTLGPLDDGSSVTYQLTYGEWIRLFRRHSFVVDDLIELRPPPHATTTYVDYVPLAWASKWPAEHIWKLRRLSSLDG